MPDGVRLAARVWWPPAAGPHPAIFAYIPYRKRDMVRARDERNHPYFAAHDYVCLRVDMRGSGDSEGHMPDMYSDDELADARHVIEWIAEQPWSNGRVGMFGTSWGGTASLQAAVSAPEPLKAVLANCATANRFEDDIHWMGGGLLTDSFEWGATLPAILAAPPDAATVGDAWYQQWRKRLDTLSFPLDAWIAHRERSRYWRHGSSLFSADKVTCPILSIGGWSDRYSNSVMSLVESCPDQCWGIVGPWGHHYPDQGEPGPAIGFQAVALAWWNHWLGDSPPESLGWPRLRIWRRELEPSQDRLVCRQGEWIEVDVGRDVETCRLSFRAGQLLSTVSGTGEVLPIPHDLRHGECAGDTGYFGRVGGLPLEQTADDQRSLCFDSDTLAEDIDLIGKAVVTCDIARDREDAQLVCRVCEIHPSGESHLVTRQVVHLALDESMDGRRDFVPGALCRYRISLTSTAYRFRRGNRIRVALGASYWPLVWPSRQAAALRIDTGSARLDIVKRHSREGLSNAFPEPKSLPGKPAWETNSEGQLQRCPARENAGQYESGWYTPPTTVTFAAIDVAITTSTRATYRLNQRDDSSVSLRFEHCITIRRSDGTASMVSALDASQQGADMQLDATLRVSWNGESVERRSWYHDYAGVYFG